MSQENVEIVRRILGGWALGDFAAWKALIDPGITFETFMPDASEDVVARGSAEFEAFTRDWLSQWRDYRIVAEEFQGIGPDRVFVPLTQIGSGRSSGVEVKSPGFSVWTLRLGKVVNLSLHYDRDKALEAVGLSG
jgi:ketosteroid isomerase-like protein